MHEAELQGHFWSGRSLLHLTTLHVVVLTRQAVQVEAGHREVAGVEAGDGRDESNRSMAERLADAQNAQVLSCRSQLCNEDHAAWQ